MTSVILARNDSEMPGLHGNMTNSRNDKSVEAPAKEADQSKPEKTTTTKEDNDRKLERSDGKSPLRERRFRGEVT